MTRTKVIAVALASTLVLAGCNTTTRTLSGATLGGLAGGIAGNQIGSGSGNAWATGAGAALGALAGAEVGRSTAQPKAAGPPQRVAPRTGHAPRTHTRRSPYGRNPGAASAYHHGRSDRLAAEQERLEDRAYRRGRRGY